MRRRELLISGLFGPSLLGAACKTTESVPRRDKQLRPLEQFYAIGHRGCAGLLPENTPSAFRCALSHGVDAVEMDVHLTADGEIVVYHGSRLKPEITRTPGGQWLDGAGPAIMNLSVRELKSYDVGRLKPRTIYTWHYRHQRPVDGERIPTLGEVLALAEEMGNDTVKFWIETKISPLEPELTPPPGTVADAVISIVRKAGVAERTVLQSFDWRSLVYAQKVAPEIATAYLSRQSGRKDTIQVGRQGPSPWTAGIDIDDFGGSIARAVRVAGGRYWCPRYTDIEREQLGEAHGLGLKVMVWTVNRPATMRHLIKMGVDGIITDRPDLLKEVLIEMA